MERRAVPMFENSYVGGSIPPQPPR